MSKSVIVAGSIRLSIVLALAVVGAMPFSALAEEPKTKNSSKSDASAEPYRPEPGKFPLLEKAYSYRGELVFVDHANRRGSLRIQGAGTYFRNAPHPFAMLPYGIVRYHGAPADLRDIPLGTVLHAKAYLPPDPNISAVPVLPVNNRQNTAGYSGAGIAPAENHILLLEDEPSFCLRERKSWKIKDVTVENGAGLINASRRLVQEENEAGPDESMTFDSATRIWRGRECLTVQELIAEGSWPTSGKKTFDGQRVWLGITWKPTPDNIFTRFHISDIWLDETSIQRAAGLQTETHKAFIRSRWMPAWVDKVEYGKFGRATVTATLFGGMDESLYGDFKQDVNLWMNAAENTLKHAGGNYGPAHMASRGPILEVIQSSSPVIGSLGASPAETSSADASPKAPMGSSGIQIRFETDLVIEGIRPGRVVRVRPATWPLVNLPREEWLGDGNAKLEDRFPAPSIFPKY